MVQLFVIVAREARRHRLHTLPVPRPQQPLQIDRRPPLSPLMAQRREDGRHPAGQVLFPRLRVPRLLVERPCDRRRLVASRLGESSRRRRVGANADTFLWRRSARETEWRVLSPRVAEVALAPPTDPSESRLGAGRPLAFTRRYVADTVRILVST